jgi:hypothetical protein
MKNDYWVLPTFIILVSIYCRRKNAVKTETVIGLIPDEIKAKSMLNYRAERRRYLSSS